MSQGDAPPPERRSSTALANFLLATVSIVVFLGLMEAGARLYFWLRWDRHLYPMQSNQYVFPLGWSLTPGQYRHFNVDSLGFRRATEVALLPPSGTSRIFLVGGSTAFGTTGLYPQVHPAPLRDEQTIDHHLETLLNRQYPDRKFEVINAGVPEYRVFQEFTLFREKLLNMNPSLVIFLDGHNDLSFLTGDTAATQGAAPYWRNRHFNRGERVLNGRGPASYVYFLDVYLGRNSYAYYLLSQIAQAGVDRLPAGKGSSAWGAEAFEVSKEDALKAAHAADLTRFQADLPLYLNQVRDLKSLARSRGMPVLYVLQPEIVVEHEADLSVREREIQHIAFAHHRTLGTLGWRVLTEQAATELVPIADSAFGVLNLVRIADRDTATLYTDYCHLTSEGNLVVAAALADRVASMLGLPVPSN